MSTTDEAQTKLDQSNYGHYFVTTYFHTPGMKYTNPLFDFLVKRISEDAL